MLGGRHDYSWTEAALGCWTALILAILAVTSLLLRYVTNPVSCFFPAHFVASQVDYAQQLCFHSSRLHSVIQPSRQPDRDDNSRAPYSTYHQWLPLFLGVLCSLCLLPHLTWTLVRPWLWTDPHQVVTTLSQQKASSPDRHSLIKDCALLLHTGLSKGRGGLLALMTLGRKALVSLVCLLQLILIGLVFAPRLSHHDGMVEKEEENQEGDKGNATESVPLPTDVFLCDFQYQQMSVVHRYTMQCFMPLMQVYSKGLVFLIYLFLVLFILSAVDLALCTLPLVVPRLKDVTLTHYLSVLGQSGGQADSSPAHTSPPGQSGGQTEPSPAHASPPGQSGGRTEPSPAHSSRFLDSLGADGRWVLSVVKDNCGDLAACDLTVHLFQVFQNSPRPAAVSVTSPADSSGSPVMEEENVGDAHAVPMVTITDKDGRTAQDPEKGPM